MRAVLAALIVVGTFFESAVTAQVTQPQITTRYSAYVRVLDNHNRAVTQVSAAELQLRVNGATATILRVTPMRDPLTIAVLVDHCTKAVFEVRAAVDAFVRALAPGHRVGVFTVGGVPAVLVPFTNDAETLSRAVGSLGRVGCTGLHAIDGVREAYRSDEIRKAERAAVVAIVGHGMDASLENVAALMEEVRTSGKPFFTVRFKGEPDAALTEASNLTALLSTAPTDSGGTTFTLLSAAGLGSTLTSLTAILSSEQLVEFSLDPAPAPNQPLEVDAKTKRRRDRVLVSRIVETVHLHGGSPRAPRSDIRTPANSGTGVTRRQPVGEVRDDTVPAGFVSARPPLTPGRAIRVIHAR